MVVELLVEVGFGRKVSRSDAFDWALGFGRPADVINSFFAES